MRFGDTEAAGEYNRVGNSINAISPATPEFPIVEAVRTIQTQLVHTVNGLGTYPTQEAAHAGFERFEALIVATHQFREWRREHDSVRYVSAELALVLREDYTTLHLTCINLDLQKRAWSELPPELLERWRQMQAAHDSH